MGTKSLPSPKISSGDIFPAMPTVLPATQFELAVRQLDDASLIGKLGLLVVGVVSSSLAWVVLGTSLVRFDLLAFVGDDDEATGAVFSPSLLEASTFRACAMLAQIEFFV